MWELDHKGGWAPKNWCFWAVVLEKTLEIPLDCKEIQPVHPKGNRSWIFTGRTDVETEVPILWPPDAKTWLIGEDPDAGKDWGQEEKGLTEEEMVGWHHRLNGPEFEQALGVGDGQGSLVCCGPWGRKDLDTIERLNWTDKFLSDLLVELKYSCTYLKASDVHVLCIPAFLIYSSKVLAPALNCPLSHIISVHLCIIFNLFSFTSSLNTMFLLGLSNSIHRKK